MEPSKELIDELYRAKIRQAASMTPEQRFCSGPDLFDMACELMRSGIRMQHPMADETEVDRLLDERLALGRRLKERS
jgi:hypothetical protein